MISTQQVQDLLGNGGTVVGQGDTKIGKVGQVFLDDQTSEPEWATVKTGLFADAESFVPLQGARISGNTIHVSFTKDKVKDAPRVADSDGHLTQQEEAQLYGYYGMNYSEAQSDSGLPTGGTGSVQRSTSVTDDDAMTLSEERLRVGTQQRVAGKARLRKFIVHEQVTKTVPVTREEVTIEREPITDANRAAAMDGPELTEREHEVVLHAEEVVVDKDVVPMERVHLGTQTVTEQQTVTEDVRKEHLEIEGDVATSGGITNAGTKNKHHR